MKLFGVAAFLCVVSFVQFSQANPKMNERHRFNNPRPLSTCPNVVQNQVPSGVVFSQLKVNDYSSCCAQCASVQGCVAWSFTGCTCSLYSLVNGNLAAANCILSHYKKKKKQRNKTFLLKFLNKSLFWLNCKWTIYGSAT